VSALEQQNFGFQSGSQRFRRAADDRFRHQRRPPGRVRLRARVVVGKIDDPHRPAAVDEHV
jgi:hypothetical protein